MIAGARRLRLASVLVSLALALTACPSDGPTPASSPTASAPLPTTPPEGELRLAWPHEPATLNPFAPGGESPSARALIRPLWPPLFMASSGAADPQPWLAERVVSEDPRGVRVALREDAVWSDGVPVKASDVVFTWKAIAATPAAAARAGGDFDAIESVTAESATLVRIAFTRDVPAWRDLFGAGMGVLPEHALSGKDLTSAAGQWAVSGGPFVLSRYTRGLEMVLEATPKPWRVRARVQTIRVMFVPDSTTALQMLRAGRVDALGPYASPDFSRRAARDGTVSVDIGGVWTGLVFNAEASIAGDTRIRLAAAHAIDRAAIAEGLVRGEGKMLEHPFAYPDVAAAGIAYDPQRAAQLLGEAGFTGRRNGTRTKGATQLEISIASTGHDDLTQRVVRAVFAQLRAAGFAVNLVFLEDEQLWRDWLPSSRFQAAVVTMVDPPGGDLRARYHSAGIHNIARLADPGLDAAIEQGDPATIAARLAAVAPVVPLWRNQAVAVAAKDRVAGLEAVATADGMLARAHTWTV